MKTSILTTLLSCSHLLAIGQQQYEPLFDKEHTIDYLVIYDESNPNFVVSKGGREVYAQEIVDSINVVMKNSQLDYRFHLAGVYYWKGYQAPSIVAGHEAVSQSPVIQELRRKTKADMVVLLTESYGDSDSGLADHKDDAIHSDAYSCVNLSMAASAYTAAHEAGHILGGYHSRNQAEQAPSEHPWAAAFTNNEYKTVLCGMAPGLTVPVFSGPDSYWKGVRMGNEKNDNIRIIRHNLPRVSLFGEHLEPNRYYASQDILIFDKNSQDGNVSVYGNQFMVINTNADWIQQLVPNWGNIQADVKFHLEANNSGKSRTTSIMVSGDASSTKEIQVIQTPANFNIDCNNGTYQQTSDGYAEQLNFIRDFKDTEWQTLYVPFLWRFEDWEKEFEIASIKAIQQESNGEITLQILPITDALKPHIPYLIRAKRPGFYNLNLKYINLFAANTPSLILSTKNYKFTFTGTYNTISGQDMYNHRLYTMYQGHLTQTAEINAKMHAFRWYAKVTDENGNSVTTPLIIKVAQGNNPTGIENNQHQDKFMRIYELDGRQLKPAKQIQRLPTGIYIMNGQKVISH